MKVRLLSSGHLYIVNHFNTLHTLYYEIYTTPSTYKAEPHKGTPY